MKPAGRRDHDRAVGLVHLQGQWFLGGCGNRHVFEGDADASEAHRPSYCYFLIVPLWSSLLGFEKKRPAVVVAVGFRFCFLFLFLRFVLYFHHALVVLLPHDPSPTSCIMESCILMLYFPLLELVLLHLVPTLEVQGAATPRRTGAADLRLELLHPLVEIHPPLSVPVRPQFVLVVVAPAVVVLLSSVALLLRSTVLFLGSRFVVGPEEDPQRPVRRIVGREPPVALQNAPHHPPQRGQLRLEVGRLRRMLWCGEVEDQNQNFLFRG